MCLNCFTSCLINYTKMSFQEKKALATSVSAVIVGIIYYFYTFQSHAMESLNPEVDFKFWAITILLMVPAIIVTNIIVHILFGIAHNIMTKEKPDYSEDEMYRLVELKANRNSHMVFSFGFLLAMVALALGSAPWHLFNIMVMAMLTSSIVTGITHLYFYRKGISHA